MHYHANQCLDREDLEPIVGIGIPLIVIGVIAIIVAQRVAKSNLRR